MKLCFTSFGSEFESEGESSEARHLGARPEERADDRGAEHEEEYPQGEEGEREERALEKEGLHHGFTSGAGAASFCSVRAKSTRASSRKA